MEFEKLKNENGEIFKDLILCVPKVYSDTRGYFYESWNENLWKNFLVKSGQKYKPFVQDNHSLTEGLVIRGLHFQSNPFAQGKLIRCIQGEIYDVAVDLRKKSKTFGKAIGITLSDKNHKQLWIPRGFAHGFLTISKLTVVNYKVDNYWNKNCEKTIAWNDDDLSIKWPLIEEDLSKLNLSNKDLNASKMNELELDNLF